MFPLAFGLWATAAVAVLVGGPALAYRIRREEQALRRQAAGEARA